LRSRLWRITTLFQPSGHRCNCNHERVWKFVNVEPVSIPTKHEGDLQAYRVTQIRPIDGDVERKSQT
jgi:hypothetical protein